MILEKLMEIEKDAMAKIKVEEERLKTAEGFRKMLYEIDFTFELVRTNDAEKLTGLMQGLKKRQLDESEKKLIKEITNGRF
jgi:hypothetical protein